VPTEPGARRREPGAGRVGHAAAVVLLLVAIVPRQLVAWTLPLAASEERIECAPDEGLQFWTVMRYADGDLATWPESGSIYSAYPPAQYAFHALLLRAIRSGLGNDWPSRFPSSWWRLQSYPAARLGGLVLGCVTVLCAALAAQIWSRSRRLAVASGLAVALYPQLVFTNGYVNGDSYTVAAVAGLMLALSRWAAREGEAGVGWLGAAAGLVLLGKPTGYAALLPTAAWLLDALRRRMIGLGTLVRVGGTAAIVAAPMLVWNGIRNDGDPLGLRKYRELLAAAYRARPATGSWLDQAPGFLRDLERSAFGVFRNADLPLPDVFHLGAAVFVVLGLAAGVRGLRRGTPGDRDRADRVWLPPGTAGGRAALWLAATLVISVAIVVWNAWTVDYQPQGRYLLPALVPVAIAVTCGLGQVRRVGTVLLVSWLGFLAVATATAVALIHANPCVG
jgi:4-amino-4-deoxy-L-arabinose transferase-like glycosyltransferase